MNPVSAVKILEREITPAELDRTRNGFDEHTVENGAQVQSHQRFTFAAQDCDKFVGCVSGIAHKNGDWFNGWCYITDLFLEKEYRKQGLGAQLLQTLEKTLSEHGIYNIFTWTAGYEAPGFYKKQGYTVFAELENWYSTGYSQIGLRKIMTKPNLLPPGFTLRNAAWTDLEAVADLIRAVCEADGDPDDAVPASELKSEWEANFNLDSDVWVVTDPSGKVVGYEEFYAHPGHASLQGDGYVHPQFNKMGIGTALLRALDQRARLEIARAEPDLRIYLRNFMTIGDDPGRSLHENEGFKAIRFNWSMRIKLDAPPPAPEFPEGVEIRPFVEAEHLYQVYEAIEEAFADHWGHIKPSFDEWKKRRMAPERYRPDLWFVAWHGNEIAGVSMCRMRSGIGWVGSLGVRRKWRKQGLGMALLLHSFGEFYKRGEKVVGLGVDASNPTGATRLYERAGMYVETEYVCYEKEYRSGRELDEE